MLPTGIIHLLALQNVALSRFLVPINPIPYPIHFWAFKPVYTALRSIKAIMQKKVSHSRPTQIKEQPGAVWKIV